ncbi:MAG TPA: outer membrane beta-barrel protein [Polyangiaceae bacterium]|nr:outer membrane beta-barrel protein [Polyangiaceae bacterium]
MKASRLRLGLTLAAAGVIIPTAAMAQGTPPGGPTPPPAPQTGTPATPTPGTPKEEAQPAPAPVQGVTPPATTQPPEPAPAAPSPPIAPTPAPVPAAEPAPPAAEPAPPTASIAGYIDTAYHADLNHNSVHMPSVYRAYDANNGFMLHAAHLAVSHSFSPESSAFVSLDFGSDAYINTANYGVFGTGSPLGGSTGIPVDVREGYFKWTPGDLTLQAGKFVTMNGIEVVDGPLNPTMTRGFLFWLAEPVGHTGAKLNYALGGGVAHIGAGVVNGWDRLLDNNNQKTILFNADVVPSADFHAQISGSWGAEQTNDDSHHRTTIDLTGAGVLGALTLNFQALVGFESFADGSGLNNGKNDTWFGIGIQPVFVADAFSLGGRLEYFNDNHGSRLAQTVGTATFVPDKASLLNFTITPGYMVAKNLTLRAEFRIDAALSAKDAAGDSNTKLFNGKSTQPTIAIGGTYTF